MEKLEEYRAKWQQLGKIEYLTFIAENRETGRRSIVELKAVKKSLLLLFQSFLMVIIVAIM